MRYIELFAGIGGLGYGLMQAGMECVGYCEIDKFAHKAFQLLHDPEGRMWSAYDVRSVTNDDIRSLRRERGEIQLIAAGFPCQAFSIAGKREGFADRTRGTLFFEIVRFASILRPKYLLLENVTGLLSHDNGRTFETIIRTLDELGYVGEWCVLNSASYVPQNRERIFIVASLGGTGGRKVFSFEGEDRKTSIPVKLVAHRDGYRRNTQVYSPDGITEALDTAQGGGRNHHVLVKDNSFFVTKQDNEIRIREIANCLDANYFKGLDCHQQRTGVMVVGQVDTDKSQTGNVYSIDGLAPTQLKQHGNAVTKISDGFRIRKLTPLECFRLQSWPDEWYYKLKEAGISDSQLYKMAGNGVTSVVAYEIAKRIMDIERSEASNRPNPLSEAVAVKE